MDNIGRELRQARERAGISLEDVSARTKIRRPMLEAIERSEWARLPAGVLARGYLRGYARAVGLDPEPIVSRYRDEQGPDQTFADVVAAMARAPVVSMAHERMQAVVMVLLVLGSVLVLRMVRPPLEQGLPPSTASLSGPEDTQADGRASRNRAPGNPDVLGGLSATGSQQDDTARVTIEFNATSVVWVQATADGARVLYSLVNPGARSVVGARQEIVLRVGDAGAFEYRVNGVQGRSLGRRGDVREIRVTPANYVEFQDQAHHLNE